MQKNILWAGIEYHSLENCILTIAEKESEIKSTIIGMHNDMIYKVEYQIKINQNWEAIYFEIKTQLNNKIEIASYQSDGKGNWSQNGRPVEKYKGCIDIDISLTPFTNTLPINRLKLAEEKEQIIKVLYVDILEKQTRVVEQKYTRISQTTYKYENIPNDFEAIIVADDFGLIVKYPQLFKRIFIAESNYY